jgi:hypothetical protein
MTIAVCYLSPEGVVLGADSTSSLLISLTTGLTGYHYFNYNQKVFELGENSTAGVLTWGLGGLGATSYRTLIARLADSVGAKRPATLNDVATRWCDLVWPEYDGFDLVKQCRDLAAKASYVAPATGAGPAPAAAPAPAVPAPPGPAPAAGTAPVAIAAGRGGPPPPAVVPPRTEAEEKQFAQLKSDLVAGFCIAGYWMPDRTPAGYMMVFDPLGKKPAPTKMTGSDAWGAPIMIRRLIVGIDDFLKAELLASGKWTGTQADLDTLAAKYTLGHAILPIRDAVDFVHTMIFSTIKAFKFSNLFQICGGPIELAVITSDRHFRWVQHKTWDSAVEEI